MKQLVSNILERWFIREPALFRVLCTHSIEENTIMACPMRSGHRRIEYNPLLFNDHNPTAFEHALMTEGIRLLLRHPYTRRPTGCSLQAATIGSNITIGDNYCFPEFDIERPASYLLPSNKPYEWYARKIQEQLSDKGVVDSINDGEPPVYFSEDQDQMIKSENSGLSDRIDGNRAINTLDGYAPFEKGGNSIIRNIVYSHIVQKHESDSAVSEMWDEDELSSALIIQIIKNNKDWGSLAGSFAEHLKASVCAKINWRQVMSGFRASIISSKRRLTRMRPNRRTGFVNMGSIYRFDTRILVAVDVSGSISSSDLSFFYGVINSAFKYGVSSIDVIEFDVGITSTISLKKVLRNVEVLGRGGTSFQEPIDYAYENDYDGLVILTDGYAKMPQIPDNMKCRIVWVCTNQSSYDNNHEWMDKIGRTCIMEI